MRVFVVINSSNDGAIAGVFSSSAKAAEYINKHKFHSYIIEEKVVDAE